MCAAVSHNEFGLFSLGERRATLEGVALPPVVSEAPAPLRRRFLLISYGLCAALGWAVTAVFVAFRAVLENGAGPDWVAGPVELMCDDVFLWCNFMVVMALSAYQRLWLMRHTPPEPRGSAADARAAAKAVVSTRPRPRAALRLRYVEFTLTFWLFVGSTLLSMAWFPCVCAPPFFRMAMHGTIAASGVYTALALLSAFGVDYEHSAPMLFISLVLMVAAAYASTVVAGAASANVVVGAVGMAVFYWAVVLR